MTRATLLQLIAHPTALNGADVRALEQLADAFPYCQTAHLLLAKAAHDQGSMLAGQRLRRAATYAADRTRLRRLIELPVWAAAPAGPVAADAPAAVAAAPVTPDFAAAAVAPAVAAIPEVAEQQAESSETTSTQVPAADLAPEAKYVEEEAVLALEPAAIASPTDDTPAAARPAPATPSETAPLVTTPAALPATAGPEAEPPIQPIATTEIAEAASDELPVQAPPIRPPAEAATARFEFGLAEQEPAEITAYRLPELAELTTPAGEAAPVTPPLPAFRGLAEISYAPEEGSRLGLCLVATTAAQLIPGTGLPPAGEFFAPDALVLSHLAAHQLPATAQSSSVSLINSFLQRAPKTTRRRTLPSLTGPEPEAQTDLSVRSTRPEPDLASESLAKILVRQGKTDRAIAVYERLMTKYPEKKEYFAAQIESLRPSA